MEKLRIVIAGEFLWCKRNKTVEVVKEEENNDRMRGSASSHHLLVLKMKPNLLSCFIQSSVKQRLFVSLGFDQVININ